MYQEIFSIVVAIAPMKFQGLVLGSSVLLRQFCVFNYSKTN